MTHMCGIRIAAAVLALTSSSAAGDTLFRISLENNASHVQTRSVRRFAEALAAKTGGELHIEVYDSGALYRDQAALAALDQGKLEMAVPGIWQLDRMVPNLAALMLPSLFGRSTDEVHRVVDGAVGKRLNAEIEDALGVRVPGRWLDLGPILVFGVGHSLPPDGSLDRKVIRIAAGRANEERLKAMGARPVGIPWADLPGYIERGQLDGVLTSWETIASADLQAKGVAVAIDVPHYFGMYVPLVSGAAWRRLSVG
ncbi:MAG: TRAP transporter substrate-binding protein DctP, partial [Candidatus Competibacteraceae bacterium]|nr:TRAP transporter substrate-binding protein DctP [Candidatus Competibacteraceae bacterium]